MSLRNARSAPEQSPLTSPQVPHAPVTTCLRTVFAAAKHPLRGQSPRLSFPSHKLPENLFILLVLTLLLAACTTPPAPLLQPSATVPQPVQTTAASLSPTVTPTLPSPTPGSTPTPHLSGLCSPLQDVALEQFPQIKQYDMETPHPGQDDGHHGDDYAFYNFNGRSGMEGLQVYSALEGVVAAAVTDRKPYGNMVIIETPLELLPPAWIGALALPTPSPLIPPDSRMQNCPNPPMQIPTGSTRRSLYVLYGHFKEPPSVELGQRVSCGEQIGLVGSTGMSGNPHLHLEVRVGQSGARFGSMGYYDAGYTADEFANYCTWRISQSFQLVDPSKLVGLPQP